MSLPVFQEYCVVIRLLEFWWKCLLQLRLSNFSSLVILPRANHCFDWTVLLVSWQERRVLLFGSRLFLHHLVFVWWFSVFHFVIALLNCLFLQLLLLPGLIILIPLILYPLFGLLRRCCSNVVESIYLHSLMALMVKRNIILYLNF